MTYAIAKRFCSFFWVCVLFVPLACPAQPTQTSPFSTLVATLSEPSGYFDTDNLISNESSYLHALSDINAENLSGGVYVGVGPDQNFSYIAALQPKWAFLIDIRRDNLLQHLFYKALFSQASTRLAYLCLWLGRRPPEDLSAWANRPLPDLLRYVNEAPRLDEALLEQQLLPTLEAFGIPLSERDKTYIVSVHLRFAQQGLGLRFNSHNRRPQPYYPTLQQLLLETDKQGNHANYLAQEEDFLYLKEMQAADRIVPLVGNLAGPKALPALGAWLQENDLAITAFYTSNVEYYLMQDRSFSAFAATLRTLPLHAHGVFIRSYFHRFRGSHPQTVPGYASTQLVQRFSRFQTALTNGGYASYRALVEDVAPTP